MSEKRPSVREQDAEDHAAATPEPVPPETPAPERPASRQAKAAASVLRACRCGSTLFHAPALYQVHGGGETVRVELCMDTLPPDLMLTCLGCGDTGTLEYLKGRLDG